MTQTQISCQSSHEKIIDLGNKLYKLAKDSDILEFENRLPEYTILIKNHFDNINKNVLEQTEIESLQVVINKHKKITRMIDKHKESISKKLKQLHTGKAMQLLYPQE